MISKEEYELFVGDHEKYMSNFQLDRFVTIKAGGTLYGMYKQAIRELVKMGKGLRERYFDLRKLGVEACKLEEKTKSGEPRSLLDNEELDLELERKRAHLGDLQLAIRDGERVFLRFYAHARALRRTLGELTSERRAQLEEELWAFTLHRRAAMAVYAGQPITQSTILGIVSLPNPYRDDLLGKICDRKGLKSWLMENRAPAIEVDETFREVRNIRELIEDAHAHHIK